MTPDSALGTGAPWQSRSYAAVVLVTFFFVFAFLFLAAPVIPDADSYYHLAVARLFAAEGYADALPWVRFSALGETFGDKELLFHVLLIPFAATDAATGGRVALALLNAAFAAIIAAFAMRPLGWFGATVPVWLYVSAPMLTFRLIRLRPELLALLLLFGLVYAASSRRYVWVGVLAATFALSYTAFHVVLGLAVLWFLWTRAREWQLPVAAAIGAAVGLLAHPGFPDNLRIWWVQNVLFFVARGGLDMALDMGTEFRAPAVDFFLLANLGWWVGIAVLGWTAFRRRRKSASAFDERGATYAGIAAAVFLLLTLLMQRMAVYFVPLTTLTILATLPRLAPRRAAIAALALLLSAGLSLPASRAILRDLLVDEGWEAEYAAFGNRVPPAARVAAHWGPAEFYCFFAPQGRYLNVLDPVFMATDHPEVYAAQRRVFDGVEPDVPQVVTQVLESDYLAFPSTSPLFERVQFDPRVVPLFNGLTFLGRIAPERATAFVRDWNGPRGPYRFASTAAAYIDARDAGAPCVVFTHHTTLREAVSRTYELSPSGAAELRVGNVRVLAKPAGGILGKGTLFRVRLAAGTHRFEVRTCAAAGGANGFYLLTRLESHL